MTAPEYPDPDPAAGEYDTSGGPQDDEDTPDADT